jgi:hypothetical protein
MVQSLTKKQLEGMSIDKLEKHIKALEKGDYPISFKATQKIGAKKSDKSDFYIQKILEAQEANDSASEAEGSEKESKESSKEESEDSKAEEEKPKSGAKAQSKSKKESEEKPKSKAQSKGSDDARRAELNALSKRSKNKERDLLSIAVELNIPKRTSMVKSDLVEAIIKAEKAGVKPTKGAKSQSKEAIEPGSKLIDSKKGSKSKSKSKSVSKAQPKKVSVPELELTDEAKDSSPETVEEPVKIKSKSKSKKAETESKPKSGAKTPAKAEAQSKSKTKSKSKSKSQSGMPTLNCGKFSYDELLEKRLDELQKILEDKGIDASQVKSVDRARSLVCSVGESEAMDEEPNCDERDGYDCGDGKVCDVSTNPGVCVPKDIAEFSAHSMVIDGKKIIGSANAIETLRKKMAPAKAGKKPSKSTSKRVKIGEGEEIVEVSEDSDKKEKLIQTISLWTNKDPKEFKKLSIKQLQNKLENIQMMEEKGEDPVYRAKLMEQISIFTGQPESVYENWNTEVLEQRLEALGGEVDDIEGETVDVEPEKKVKKSKKDIKAEKPKVEKESESEKESKESKSEEEPSQKIKRRKAQEDIDYKKIDKILADVTSGTKTKIEDFSDIQNTVFKCLGLLSA